VVIKYLDRSRHFTVWYFQTLIITIIALKIKGRQES